MQEHGATLESLPAELKLSILEYCLEISPVTFSVLANSSKSYKSVSIAPASAQCIEQARAQIGVTINAALLLGNLETTTFLDRDRRYSKTLAFEIIRKRTSKPSLDMIKNAILAHEDMTKIAQHFKQQYEAEHICRWCRARHARIDLKDCVQKAYQLVLREDWLREFHDSPAFKNPKQQIRALINPDPKPARYADDEQTEGTGIEYRMREMLRKTISRMSHDNAMLQLLEQGNALLGCRLAGKKAFDDFLHCLRCEKLSDIEMFPVPVGYKVFLDGIKKSTEERGAYFMEWAKEAFREHCSIRARKGREQLLYCRCGCGHSF